MIMTTDYEVIAKEFLNSFKLHNNSNAYWNIFLELKIDYSYRSGKILHITYKTKHWVFNNIKHPTNWRRGNYIRIFKQIFDEDMLINMQKYLILNI